jgi:hypothetical protein
MATIPEVRERIRQLAEAHPQISGELLDIERELHRRPVKERAEPRSEPMTPELRTTIRMYRREYPYLPLQAIADVFNVNIGRVSEALRGKRS